MIEDRRTTVRKKPFGYIVCADRFMSGWGRAKDGISWMACEVRDEKEAEIVENNMWDRSEMYGFTFVDPEDIKDVAEEDHFSITDWVESPKWYVIDAFKEK